MYILALAAYFFAPPIEQMESLCYNVFHSQLQFYLLFQIIPFYNVSFFFGVYIFVRSTLSVILELNYNKLFCKLTQQSCKYAESVWVKVQVLGYFIHNVFFSLE